MQYLNGSKRKRTLARCQKTDPGESSAMASRWSSSCNRRSYIDPSVPLPHRAQPIVNVSSIHAWLNGAGGTDTRWSPRACMVLHTVGTGFQCTKIPAVPSLRQRSAHILEGAGS